MRKTVYHGGRFGKDRAWFSDNPKVAGGFGKITWDNWGIPQYNDYQSYEIEYNNPFIMDAKGENWLDIKTPKKLKPYWQSETIDSNGIVDICKKLGYDCIIIKNIEEGTTGAIGTDYCLLNGKYKNINESLNKLIDKALDESLEKYDDFYATNSEYEFLAFMKRAKTGYRVLYDIKNKYYFMAEATSCVHPDLLKKAVQNGYYPELTITTYWDYFLTELGMSLMDFLFFPLNMDNKQLTQDRVSDGHTYKYTYDFGIFWVHYTSSLEPCSVYDLIGEPKEFEEIFPEGFGESLNEHLEKMGDCFITKSPYDIVNLFKNKPKEYRVLYDKNIDMYMIGDAESVTHYDMVQKAYKDAYYYNMEDFIQDLGGTIDNYTEMGQSGYWDGEDDENFDAYLWYIVFSPNEEWELGTDGYNKKYDYSFGHVFTRGCDLSEIGLWDALGVPENSEKLNESADNTMILYHGSSNPVERWEDKPTFFADSSQWAEDWALGSEYDYQIYADDEPTLYTAEVTMNKTYKIKDEDEYNELMDYGTDHSLQINGLKKQGYDSMMYNGAYNTTYYLVFSNKQFKITNAETLDTSSCDIIDESLNEPNLNDAFWKWFGKSKLIKNGQPMVFYHGTNKNFDKFSYKKTNDTSVLGKGFYFTADEDIAKTYLGGLYGKPNKNSHVKQVYLKMENPLYADKQIDEKVFQLITDCIKNHVECFWTKAIPIPDDSYIDEGILDHLNIDDILKWKKYAYGKKNNSTNATITYLSKGNNLLITDILYLFTNGYNQIRMTQYIQDAIRTLYDGVIFTSFEGCLTYLVFDANQIKAVDNKGTWSITSDNIYESLNKELERYL